MNLEERERELKEHIRIEHRRSPFAAHLKEIVYGGVDGIITTFAVVAGFSGAALSSETTIELTSMVVLLFGIANLMADGVSMGLGNFLSIRSNQSLYAEIRKKEEYETGENGDVEAEETVTILMEKGFSEEDARALTVLYRKNPDYWIDFMMNHELKIPDPREDRPIHAGLMTFISFVVFGVIPLIPFIFLGALHEQTLFEISTFGTIIALALLGLFKGEVIGTKAIRSMGEVMLIGGIAASVAFVVGTLIA